jgi:hypothetical protein
MHFSASFCYYLCFSSKLSPHRLLLKHHVLPLWSSSFFRVQARLYLCITSALQSVSRSSRFSVDTHWIGSCVSSESIQARLKREKSMLLQARELKFPARPARNLTIILTSIPTRIIVTYLTQLSAVLYRCAATSGYLQHLSKGSTTVQNLYENCFNIKHALITKLSQKALSRA